MYVPKVNNLDSGIHKENVEVLNTQLISANAL